MLRLSFWTHSRLVRRHFGYYVTVRLGEVLRAVWAPGTMAEPIAFAVGLLSTELVMRGGFLKKPVLLQGLQCEEGKQFLYLWKNSNELSQCFGNALACKRPLVGTVAFEKVLAARNAKYTAMMQELLHGGQPDDDEDRPPVDLGLDMDDDELAATAGPSGGAIVPVGLAKLAASRRTHRALKRQLPKTASVSIDMGSDLPPWTPCLLMEDCKKAAAMEVTPHNLEMLFRLVRQDLDVGGIKRERYGSSHPTGSRPPPRGPAHARQYAVGRFWVTKIQDSSSTAGHDVNKVPSRPHGGKQNFRTLKRLRSDEAEKQREKDTAAPKRGTKKKQSVAPPAVLMDTGDCLGD